MKAVGVSIPFKRESGSKAAQDAIDRLWKNGFNSLQAGKRIQSKRIEVLRERIKTVSIPFKRESGSKVKLKMVEEYLGQLVSIPFKRESGSKAYKSF